MIHSNSVSFSAGSKSILFDISVQVPKGKITALIGSNGSGKSTLLKVLAGSIKAQKGEVHYGDNTASSIKPDLIAKQRAVVSQSYPDDIPFTGREIVNMPISIYQKKYDEYINQLIQELDMAEYIDRKYSRLSGGERQRVQIARALMQYFISEKSEFTLFLDEPGSGLDISASVQLCKILKKLSREGLSVFWVIHDLNMALEIADRIILMEAGHATTHEDPSQLFDGEILSNVFGIEFQPYQKVVAGFDGNQPINKLHPRL